MFAAKSFDDMDINFNSDGWGPVIGEKNLIFNGVPYAHFDKKDKCWRPADFTFNQQQQQQNQRYNRYNRRDDHLASSEFAYRHDAVEDSTFQLVDSTKANPKKFTGVKKTWNPQGGRGGSGGRGGRGVLGGRGGSARDAQYQQQSGGRGGRGTTARGGGRGGGGYQSYRRNDRKIDRVPSLTVEADWELIDEFDLAQLLKLVANPPKVEDLLWCGHLEQYDETYDKLTTKTAKPLRHIDNKIFYGVTTSEDPILERFAAEELGDIFATDAILSQLMAAPRSVFSWDIIIQKVNNMVFLDKREGSTFDFLTVSETAREPPVADDVDSINHPQKLSLEATMINQNFSQQVLKEDVELRKTYEPNPFFFDEDGGTTQPAAVAYRYRKFMLGNIRLITRCELHGWMRRREDDLLMTCYALNEWDSKFGDGVNWRQKIDQQRGAVLATELKNNSCKLAKWTAQSIISGAENMKLGYISRVTPTNAADHVILATQFFKPKELAVQINLGINNIWGIVKMISELLMSKHDGKYALIKDPNKATLRLYELPVTAFEDGEGEEDGVGGADGHHLHDIAEDPDEVNEQAPEEK